MQQNKTTTYNGKTYTLYPMTGTASLEFAFDLAKAFSPSIAGLFAVAVKALGDKDLESLSMKTVMDSPDVLSHFKDVDLTAPVEGFFRNCDKAVFMDLWSRAKDFIKEGTAKQVNWEHEFQGNPFGQITLLLAYIKAYNTPFLSSLSGSKSPSPQSNIEIV